MGLGRPFEGEDLVHVDLQIAPGYVARQLFEVAPRIVAQPFDQVGELEAVDGDVLGVEVASVYLAAFERDRSLGSPRGRRG